MIKNLVKYASTHFHSKEKKKEENRRVLFQKKPPPQTTSTASMSALPVSRLSSFIRTNTEQKNPGHSSSAGLKSESEGNLEDLIETGLKRTFLRSATKINEEHAFIAQTTKTSSALKASSLGLSKTKAKRANSSDSRGAKGSWRTQLYVAKFTRKLKKGTQVQRASMLSMSAELELLEGGWTFDVEDDPGPECTSLLSDEVRHELAGVRDAQLLPSQLADKRGSQKAQQTVGERAMRSVGLSAAKRRAGGECFSELARSVRKSASATGGRSAGTERWSGMLNALATDDDSINRTTMLLHSDNALFIGEDGDSPDPRGSKFGKASTLQNAPKARFHPPSFNMDDQMTTSAPMRMTEHSIMPPKMNRHTTSSGSRKTHAPATTFAKSRSEDSAHGPREPSRLTVSTEEGTPSRTSKYTSGTPASRSTVRSGQRSPMRKTKTQNMIGTVEENVLEEATMLMGHEAL
jgi:hypothetical protein